jgi:hypothetical protein
MTEQFGPCGIGWGMDKPEFQLVTVKDDIAVYCTVSLWYLDGDKRGVVYGVGGDFAAKTNKYGLSADDEAFKKSFTDALSNAMKHLGVGADVHMGQFDDLKYVNDLKREFAEEEREQKKPANTQHPVTRPVQLDPAKQDAATKQSQERAAENLIDQITKTSSSVALNDLWKANAELIKALPPHLMAEVRSAASARKELLTGGEAAA